MESNWYLVCLCLFLLFSSKLFGCDLHTYVCACVFPIIQNLLHLLSTQCQAVVTCADRWILSTGCLWDHSYYNGPVHSVHKRGGYIEGYIVASLFSFMQCSMMPHHTLLHHSHMHRDPQYYRRNLIWFPWVSEEILFSVQCLHKRGFGRTPLNPSCVRASV